METEMGVPQPPSYSKLRSGEWGVRLTGRFIQGQIVNVVRKDKQVMPVKLGNLVWEGNGVQLFAIDNSIDHDGEEYDI